MVSNLKKNNVGLCSSLNVSISDESSLEVCHSPFRHVRLPQLLGDEDFIDDLISELNDLELLDKNNDLYKFKQVIISIKTIIIITYSYRLTFSFGKIVKFTSDFDLNK